jgi:hypothetical protein
LKKLVLVTIALSALVALAVAGLAQSATRKGGYKLSAHLTAKQEVPKPKGASGSGTFTGTLNGNKLTWRLTFTGLTGRAGAAHIHLGRAGVAGGVIVALCGPCRSGQHGTLTVSKAAHDAIERNRTYVNVHTAKNAAGEIRGQVKAVDL